MAILQQLESLSQKFSVQIQLFDSAVFNTKEFHNSENLGGLTDSESSNNKYQLKSSFFDVDLGEQLGTSLIQDTDYHPHEEHPESKSINLSFHENVHRNQILWHSVQQYIVQNEIDSVVFLASPQGLNESILYQVSKALKIDVLILCQSPVSDRLFSFCAISDCGNYDKNFHFSTEIFQPNEENSSNRKQLYRPINCKTSKAIAFFKILSFLIKSRSLKLLNPVYILRHTKYLHDAPADIEDWKDPFAKFFYCKSTAYFEFITNYHTQNIDLNQKFVYFPLQSLKELHSEILDNQFGDQLLALEQLACLVPIDCKIFLKSDPNRDTDYLTPMFFHRIKRISNVVRLPSLIESEQLIDKSMFVATVNSEDGWSALFRGKKVLIFGKPWYRKLPGAYEYRDGLESVEITEPEFDHSEFRRHINCLLAQSDTGRLLSNDESNVNDVQSIENAKRVAETILDLLSGRKNPTFQSESI